METAAALPDIPYHTFDEHAWPLALIDAEPARAELLRRTVRQLAPPPLLGLADRVSRRWLAKRDSPYNGDIEAIVAAHGADGFYALNISYEWGCTSKAAPSPDGSANRLVRVLDWPQHGIGRAAVAITVAGPRGRWTALTWPGFVGVVQALAPGRFAAALNLAPLARRTGSFALDWFLLRLAVDRGAGLPPAHLLRQLFEETPDYAEAKQRLTETPLALPAIFILSGLTPEQGCVIERRERHAVVHDDPRAAANHWRGSPKAAWSRGPDSPGRARALDPVETDFATPFRWLVPPIFNKYTRLALLAEAKSGRLAAQGFDQNGPVTSILTLP